MLKRLPLSAYCSYTSISTQAKWGRYSKCENACHQRQQQQQQRNKIKIIREIRLYGKLFALHFASILQFKTNIQLDWNYILDKLFE